LVRVEKSIVIRAPPERVWKMLALDRLLEWEEGCKKNVKSMEFTSEVSTLEDKYRVGASVRMIGKGEGEMGFKITESLENEKITYRSEGGKFTKYMMWTYIFEPVEKGAKLTCVLDYELPWGIFGKILGKLLAQRMDEKDLEKSFGNLKSILEK